MMADLALKVLLIVFLSLPKSFAIDNEETDRLVRQYVCAGYTVKEIVSAILFLNYTIVSKRTVKRILRRLNLRRNTESSLFSIVRGIRWLYTHGYRNYNYRWIWNLLNNSLGIRAFQETVRHALSFMVSKGVIERERRRLRRRQYVNRGPNFVIHIDGYDKLKPFGISIHGAIGGFSRKILWLKAGSSNKNPYFISHFYLSFLMELQRIPRVLRFDAELNDTYIALRMHHGDNMSGINSCSTGRSTANQRIKMLWSILRRGFTSLWRNLFKDMIDKGILDNTDPLHLECIFLCFLPAIQKHLDDFANTWNRHRIRSQRNNECPTGIPNIMYHQPFLYGTSDQSFELPCQTNDLLVSGQQYSQPPPVLDCSSDMLQLALVVSGFDENCFLQVRCPNEYRQLFENLISHRTVKCVRAS